MTLDYVLEYKNLLPPEFILPWYRYLDTFHSYHQNDTGFHISQIESLRDMQINEKLRNEWMGFFCNYCGIVNATELYTAWLAGNKFVSKTTEICRWCHGTKLYQPLTGPSESCNECK